MGGKINRAQERIVEPGEENTELRNAMSKSENVEEDHKAAKLISEGEGKIKLQRPKRSPPDERKNLANGQNFIQKTTFQFVRLQGILTIAYLPPPAHQRKYNPLATALASHAASERAPRGPKDWMPNATSKVS